MQKGKMRRMRPEIWCTYIIENLITGRSYIGWTDKWNKRWSIHKKVAKSGPIKDATSYSYVHKGISKYGVENFTFNIFETYSTEEEAKLGEVFWIAEMKRHGIPLYNLTDGGDGISGYEYSPEQCAAISERMKGKFVGEKNPFFGKTHSDEVREFLSKQMSERHVNKEFVGSNHAHPKLNEEQVLQIRKEYASTSISQAELGEKYEVSRKSIQVIIQNKTWTHVESIAVDFSNLRHTKQNAHFSSKYGPKIIFTIECEACHQNFDIEQRERSPTKLPRFCSRGCKNAALANHSI